MPEFPLALTYDDVLLAPRRSSIALARDSVDTTARFTRGLAVASPVVAANMETVTEAPMAIAMARAGGIGVIHRFLPLAQQVAEVERVKRAENLVIARPYAIAGTATVAEALELMAQREVRSLLRDGRRRTARRDPDDARPACWRSPATPSPSTRRRATGWSRPPPASRSTRPASCSTPTGSRSCRSSTRRAPRPASSRCATSMALRERPHASKDHRGQLLVAAAVGVRGDWLERAQALLAAGADALVLDIAHGHADHAVAALERLRSELPDAQLVAGNVATGEGAERPLPGGRGRRQGRSRARDRRARPGSWRVSASRS